MRLGPRAQEVILLFERLLWLPVRDLQLPVPVVEKQRRSSLKLAAVLLGLSEQLLILLLQVAVIRLGQLVKELDVVSVVAILFLVEDETKQALQTKELLHPRLQPPEHLFVAAFEQLRVDALDAELVVLEEEECKRLIRLIKHDADRGLEGLVSLVFEVGCSNQRSLFVKEIQIRQLVQHNWSLQLSGQLLQVLTCRQAWLLIVVGLDSPRVQRHPQVLVLLEVLLAEVIVTLLQVKVFELGLNQFFKFVYFLCLDLVSIVVDLAEFVREIVDLRLCSRIKEFTLFKGLCPRCLIFVRLLTVEHINNSCSLDDANGVFISEALHNHVVRVVHLVLAVIELLLLVLSKL